MHKLQLFFAPGTCARVPTIALEEIGAPFETELVRLAAKQQLTPDYLAVNPRGKVPALLIDGRPLTENVAILTWLNQTYPTAGLMPEASASLERAKQTADLAFFSSTIHPIVTRIAMPMSIVDGDEASGLVRQKAIEGMMRFMSVIDGRLGKNLWWYGDQWSIVDGYLFWAWWRITGAGFPDTQFPNIRHHAERIVDRPSVSRALQREAKYVAQLKSEGLYRAPMVAK